MTGENDVDLQFYQLVLSLQAAAMQQMGKIANPVTGQIERDMILSKNSIDMLEMFERKTRGNLSSEEKRLMDHVLYELRMNFLDEIGRDKGGAKPPDTGANSTPSSADTSL